MSEYASPEYSEVAARLIQSRAANLRSRLWEIDENLMRAELSPTEMAEHLAKREELWAARQSAQVAPVESKRDDGRGHRSRGFASETTGKTGESFPPLACSLREAFQLKIFLTRRVSPIMK